MSSGCLVPFQLVVAKASADMRVGRCSVKGCHFLAFVAALEYFVFSLKPDRGNATSAKTFESLHVFPS